MRKYKNIEQCPICKLRLNDKITHKMCDSANDRHFNNTELCHFWIYSGDLDKENLGYRLLLQIYHNKMIIRFTQAMIELIDANNGETFRIIENDNTIFDYDDIIKFLDKIDLLVLLN